MNPILATLLLGLQTAPTAVLKGLDPVELCSGREIAGKEDLTQVEAGYLYRFSSEANRLRFTRNPGKYGVQIGGACGNMGPLSGRGSTERWLVHDGRIWLFASEGCRNAFKTDPPNYLDAPDPRPTATPQDQREGRLLIDRAVAAHGGAEALDRLKTLVWLVRTPYRSGARQEEYVQTFGVRFPNAYVQMESWEGQRIRTTVQGKKGWVDARKRDPLVDSERRWLEKTRAHHPLVVLRARGDRDFIAKKLGENTVLVWTRGAATTLHLDPESGRVLKTESRERFGGPYTRVERTYSGWGEHDGVQVPTTWRVAGRGRDGGVRTYETRVNAPADMALFD